MRRLTVANDMKFFRDKIEGLRCGWNTRPLGEKDFFELCDIYKVTVVETAMTTSGFYYCAGGTHHIAVDSKLEPFRKLFVLYHEFAHYLMHAPRTTETADFHGVAGKTRNETEADMFALCALMPQPWVLSGRLQEIAAELGIPAELVGERYELFRSRGL